MRGILRDIKDDYKRFMAATNHLRKNAKVYLAFAYLVNLIEGFNTKIEMIEPDFGRLQLVIETDHRMYLQKYQSDFNSYINDGEVFIHVAYLGDGKCAWDIVHVDRPYESDEI